MEKMQELSKTGSVCPECLRILPATIFERNGKVWIKKTCEEHGEFEDLYSGSYEWYKRAKRYARDGRGVENPQVTKDAPVCPKDCGLCTLHLSHTALANVVLTNRCDLSCWYCFFYAGRAGYVYEPAIEDIDKMLKILKEERPIPCNALQLSLAPTESITVKNPDGELIAVKIGEFVDGLMKRNGSQVFLEPIKHERTSTQGWEVLSVDKDFKCTFKPVDHIIRHENHGEMYRIETESGWRITTTGAHSLFVLQGCEVKPKQIKDLRNGDVLLGSLSVPGVRHKTELDLPELILKFDPTLARKIRVSDFSRSDAKSYQRELGRRVNWDSIGLDEYLRCSVKAGGAIRYFNSRKWKKLPLKIKITPELCRLLGYYVGEGCQYRSGVIFSFGPKENKVMADFIRCVSAVFGVQPRKVSGRHEVQFYLEGYLYKLFFKILGAGGNAVSKRVPAIILNVADDLKKEFLRSYFKCDGNVKMRAGGYEINHNTVSERLASDLVFLHVQLGVVPKVERSFSEPHLMEKTGQYISKRSKKYRIVIGGKEELGKSLWYLDGLVRRKFEKYISTEERHAPQHLRFPSCDEILALVNRRTDNPGINYILKGARHDKSISKENLRTAVEFFAENGMVFDERLNGLSHSDIGFFKVRKIEKVKPNYKYVYDISVHQSQAFFAGLGPILAHNTGGEPTLRKDLLEIIKLARSHGFDHIQLNTDGIRLANNPNLVNQVRDAGVNTLYLSFDGVTEKTNPKNHWEIPQVVENSRRENLGIVLVPTVIKSVNDHEVGDIVKYGFKNIDIIRGVNFQPVSLVGRMPREEREKFRITIPDVIKRLEEQTDGAITSDDFFPVPAAMAISDFVEALTGKPMYGLSSHFACGAATYVFEDGGKILPLTRFIDIEGLFEYLGEKSQDLKAGKSKLLVGTKLLYNIGKFIDKKKKPEGLDVDKIIFNAFVKHDYGALGQFHMKSMLIGMMHFQDLYNYDIERVKRCCIHYTMTDNRVIPFCAFNVIPQWYRDQNQKAHGVSFEEWEEQSGRKMSDDLYKRDIPKLKSSEAYQKFVKQIEEIRAGS